MSFLSIAIYVLLSLVAGVYLYFKWQFSFFKKKGIPFLEPSIPLGNLTGVGKTFHSYDILRKFFDATKNKGKVVGFYSLTSPAYMPTDIEIMKHIVVKDFNNFTNRGVFENEKDEPLTGHLFAIEDERWRFLRNKLSPVFTSGKLKNMFIIANNKSKNLIKAIERKGKFGATIETKNVANRFTVDIISSVAFGMESNTLNDEHQELIDIFREIFGAEGPSLLYFTFLLTFPNISKKLKLRQFSKKVSDFFTEVVAGNISYRESSNEKRNDFLDMLIQLKNKGSIDGEFSSETKKLTLNECLAQAFVFFFAGADTSSSAISFTLTELAFNGDIQDKLRQEIEKRTKDSNGELTYENVQEMTYLNQVISESLRMHGPVPFIIRKSNQDYKIPDTDIVIEKGNSVWIPIDALHHDDRFWKNPYKFDPERFTQEEIAKRPSLCYFPFGEGPRNCIGMRLGLLNVKMGVASIIQNFKVIPDYRLQYPLKYSPTSTNAEPEGGFLLKFEKI